MIAGLTRSGGNRSRLGQNAGCSAVGRSRIKLRLMRARGFALASCSTALVALIALRAPGATNAAPPMAPAPPPAAVASTKRCFLLYEVGVGRRLRAPAEGCAVRVPPMSTFKIPHALAALEPASWPMPTR